MHPAFAGVRRLFNIDRERPNSLGYRWDAFNGPDFGSDSNLWGQGRSKHDFAMWALADGHGQSETACAAVKAFLKNAAEEQDPRQALRSGFAAAATAVNALAKHDRDSAYSTSLVGFIMKGMQGFVAHAGNCAFIHVRRGQVVYKIRDQQLLELKAAAEKFFQSPTHANDDQSIESCDTLSWMVTQFDLQNNDLILICTDGVISQLPQVDFFRAAKRITNATDLIEKVKVQLKKTRPLVWTSSAAITVSANPRSN